MPAIAGKRGRIYGATALIPTAITNEAMTANDDRTRYTVTNTARRYLDPRTLTTFEVSTDDGSTWDSIVPASVEYAGGVAVFSPGLAVGALVRVAAGAFFPVAPIAECKSWSVDLSVALEDSTVLGDNWKRHTPINLGWEASLERFQFDSYFMDRIVPGIPVLLVLYVNEAGKLRYEGFANLSNLGTKVESKGLVTESVDAQGESELYPRFL